MQVIQRARECAVALEHLVFRRTVRISNVSKSFCPSLTLYGIRIRGSSPTVILSAAVLCIFVVSKQRG